MDRSAYGGTPECGVSQKRRKKDTSLSRAARATGSASSVSLLELQLQALVESSSCSPPDLRQGGASAVIADFVSFLKQFLLKSFRPVRIRLDGSDSVAAPIIQSEKATTLFGRVPGNSKATKTEWNAPRPAGVEIIGSCGAGFGPASFARNIDLAFKMPDDCLDKRDYLNYR